MNSDEAARLSQELCEQIAPILAGNEPEIQSATLADLTARWLAGHFIADKRTSTNKLREQLLREHMRLVRQLIPVNEKMILERLQKH